MRTRFAPSNLPSLLIASTVLLAGVPALEGQQRATPRAPFATITETTPSDSVLQAYFRSLRFLADTAAAQRVAIQPSGAMAGIQPEAGMYLLNEAAMREGRVIARIVYSGRDTLHRLGWAPRSVTYWWVQYDGERGAAVMISTNAATGAIVSRTPVRVRQDTHLFPPGPRARFTQTAMGLALGCAPCPRLGWCGGDTTRSRTWPEAMVPITRAEQVKAPQ